MHSAADSTCAVKLVENEGTDILGRKRVKHFLWSLFPAEIICATLQ